MCSKLIKKYFILITGITSKRLYMLEMIVYELYMSSTELQYNTEEKLLKCVRNGINIIRLENISMTNNADYYNCLKAILDNSDYPYGTSKYLLIILKCNNIFFNMIFIKNTYILYFLHVIIFNR